MTILAEPVSAAEPTPIDRYLATQADLTAVERFAQRHEAELLPRQARYYRDLIPLARPGPGQQYGFEVDLDACTGCKACVAACHSLNGLDDDESWRTVGLLHGGTAAEPFQQTVTTACHHCVDPACLNGCPVDAYEKDPTTGIVVHLDDQCIGCSYCTLTCPYEVPRFNPARGIVRKCDMCSGRLAAGEAPACVQACPNEAIRIAVVDTAAMVEAATAGATLVPGAPPSSITVPTTVYRTERGPVGEVMAADRFSVRPAQAHPPLAVMLVLTQLSVGAFVTDLTLRARAGGPLLAALRPYNAAVALMAGLLALAASVLHLGRPRYAFRAVIGLRHSWLSREAVAFAAFATLAVPYAVTLGLGPSRTGGAAALLGGLVAGVGLAGVGCSVMIYATTRRTWWRARATALRFALTTAVCGLATVLCTSLASALVVGGSAPARAVVDLSRPLALLVVLTTTLKLAWEAAVFRHLRDLRRPGPPHHDDLRRTARFLARDLRPTTVRRFGAGLAGGLVLPLGVVATTTVASPAGAAWPAAALAALALVTVVAGELWERSLFFTAVTSPRMPGSLP